ncbi:hypothetical protein [Roseiconus lacunae]|uniref:Uncharacterized protein n=1 Tax=Roseiconus lacunae TaxID=2605694 RepID=A0ABT7PPE7_9BACT|nr:hypothetical protein [Roseiconus lacunae]MDM4018385.1 hypothetical protein [Roseiconus lacunae]WRQ49254.1 hypothetical protein U8335_20125 [Stieleria sp. HD01]
MIYDPYQPQKLTGRHAELYCKSLALMLDSFRDCFQRPEEDLVWTFGVRLFDGLGWREKLMLLLKVSKLALLGEGDIHEWGALEKAACFSVYHHVFQQLEIERDVLNMDMRSRSERVWIDPGDEEAEEAAFALDEMARWKLLIEEAYAEDARQEGVEDDEIQSILEHPEDEEDDLNHYYSLIDLLAGRLIDDRDFEMADTFLDLDPDVASELKSTMGISDDYFIQMADDAPIEKDHETFDALAKLAGAVKLNDRFEPPY